MKSDHNADEGLEMAFDDTVAVAQVRAYKDKIETDKIGCTVFLSDWLKLMPDKMVKDLLQLAAGELAEVAREYGVLGETPPGPGGNGGPRGH